MLHIGSVTLSEDGSINIPGAKLWLVQAEAEDRSFIISTWVKSYQAISRRVHTTYNEWCHRVTDEVFTKHHPKIVERLWDKAMVLKGEMDDSAIYGYVVSEPTEVLHYVYLIPELRAYGKAGIKGLGSMLAHIAIGNEGQLSHMWPYRWHGGWSYNPYAAMKYS